MALIKCPECKKKISDQCSNCPNCGYPINKIDETIDSKTTNVESVDEATTKTKKIFNIKSLIKKWWFWGAVGVFVVVIIITTIVLLMPCKHEWVDATCESPVICSKCGETAGKATGHTWKEASCTVAKTCSICGKTTGESAGHVWKDATCTSPKTCSLCNATEGEPLGHTWTEATYSSPKTCTVCSATEGSALKNPTTRTATGTYQHHGVDEDGPYTATIHLKSDGTSVFSRNDQGDVYGTWKQSGNTITMAEDFGGESGLHYSTLFVSNGGIITTNGLFYTKID